MLKLLFSSSIWAASHHAHILSCKTYVRVPWIDDSLRINHKLHFDLEKTISYSWILTPAKNTVQENQEATNELVLCDCEPTRGPVSSVPAHPTQFPSHKSLLWTTYFWLHWNSDWWNLPAVGYNPQQNCRLRPHSQLRSCTYLITNHGNSLAKSTDSVNLGAFADVYAQYSFSDEVYCYHC